MKIVISSFGSSGDFNPCLGLGRALKQKGVDVIFLSNPYHEKKIIDAGLRFFQAGEYWDVAKEIRDKPAYLHPRKGPRAVWDLVLQVAPVMYHAMGQLIRNEKPDMVACHILEYGGMMAAIEQSIPYTVLSPTPMGWFNADPPGHLNFTELPHWLRCLQAHMLRGLMNIAVKYSFGGQCKKEGVVSPFKTFEDVYSKAVLNLGLWSKLFKGVSPDDPPNSQICGFVRDKHVCDWDDVPEEIVRLFEGPQKPIVVGLGSTASAHGDAIYQKVARICSKMDVPCLLIGHNLSQYADPERRILSLEFAPYGWVFPRAAMIIHHGGVNTSAETLRAGVPALIVPHAHDQFDNAIRIERMGLSKRLKPNASLSAFNSSIQSILHNRQMHQNAQAFGMQLRSQPDGAEVAADCIIKTIQTVKVNA